MNAAGSTMKNIDLGALAKKPPALSAASAGCEPVGETTGEEMGGSDRTWREARRLRGRTVGIGPQVGFIFPVSDHYKGYLNLKAYKDLAVSAVRIFLEIAGCVVNANDHGLRVAPSDGSALLDRDLCVPGLKIA